MKQIALLIFFFFTILLLSCKKDTKTVTNSPVPCPNIDPNSFMGSFRCFKYLSYQNGQVISSQTPLVEFYRHPYTSWSLNEIANLNVSVNSRSLTNNPVAGHYGIPSGTVDLSVDNWSISGDSIPSFTHTNTKPFPNCTNFFTSPDSISKTIGCTFTIANVTDMDKGSIFITDSVQGKYPHTYSLSLTPGTNVITISAAQISNWTIGTTGYVLINMCNTSMVNACDRNYWFMKNVSSDKGLKIIP